MSEKFKKKYFAFSMTVVVIGSCSFLMSAIIGLATDSGPGLFMLLSVSGTFFGGALLAIGLLYSLWADANKE